MLTVVSVELYPFSQFMTDLCCDHDPHVIKIKGRTDEQYLTDLVEYIVSIRLS